MMKAVLPGFATLPKLREAEAAERKMKGKPQTVGAMNAWLEEQDAYTLHRLLRKRFARNSYTVTNVMNVWECYLLDIQAYAEYNDKYNYILSVIDVFSKFLFLVPLKTKSGPAVTTAFLSIFDDDPKKPSRRPVWVRTDKGKEFITKHFQDMLRDEGIQFQESRNPDVKCAVVDPAHRTIHDRLYKYFTYKNTFRYIDVLSKFVRAYNDDRYGAFACDRFGSPRHMEEDEQSTHSRAKVKFSVGQHVRMIRRR